MRDKVTIDGVTLTRDQVEQAWRELQRVEEPVYKLVDPASWKAWTFKHAAQEIGMPEVGVSSSMSHFRNGIALHNHYEWRLETNSVGFRVLVWTKK